MKAPNKLYFDGESSACEQPIFSSRNIEYIRKDALLEWAKEREAETRDKAGTDDVVCAYHDAIMDLIEKLNSM